MLIFVMLLKQRADSTPISEEYTPPYVSFSHIYIF